MIVLYFFPLLGGEIVSLDDLGGDACNDAKVWNVFRDDGICSNGTMLPDMHFSYDCCLGAYPRTFFNDDMGIRLHVNALSFDRAVHILKLVVVVTEENVWRDVDMRFDFYELGAVDLEMMLNPDVIVKDDLTIW